MIWDDADWLVLWTVFVFFPFAFGYYIRFLPVVILINAYALGGGALLLWLGASDWSEDDAFAAGFLLNIFAVVVLPAIPCALGGLIGFSAGAIARRLRSRRKQRTSTTSDPNA